MGAFVLTKEPSLGFHKGNIQYGDKMYKVTNGNFIFNADPTTTNNNYNTFHIFDGFMRIPVDIWENENPVNKTEITLNESEIKSLQIFTY